MRKATALITVLVIMIIVGLGTTAILQAMISFSQMRKVNVERIRAQYLAEAGVQYGLWQCKKSDFSSPVTIVEDGTNIVITKTSQGGGSYIISATVQY